MENVTNDEVFEMIDSRTGVLNANDWKSQLRRSATTQALKKTTTNSEIILCNDESLKGLVKYDAF